MKSKIRLAVLNREAGKIRELFLATSQIDIWYEIVSFRLFTAAKLATSFDISISNASSKLNRLYKAGYLSREDRTAESGGIEYIYSVPEELIGKSRE